MSDEHHTRATLENQAFALMGRLHVILRRQTGRVTDIEYMRIDPAYCRYLLKLASLSDNADLREIGLKLEDIYFGPEGLFVKGEPRPLLARLTEQEASPKVSPPATSAAPAAPKTDDDIDRGYIGRLR
jgi:hypothetical protein